MFSEMTVFRGEICIDARCNFCLRAGRLTRRFLRRNGYRLRSLRAPDVAKRLGLAPGEVGDQFMLIPSAGHAVGGAAAGSAVLKAAVGPLAAPLELAAPRRWLDRAYRWAAKRYHCRDGACPPRAVATPRLRTFAEAIHLGLIAARRRGAL